MAPRWRDLRDLERACPIRIRTILTDNGKEFTDRLFGLRRRAATGAHEFDQLCAERGIEHRPTPPASPQTNGMVERFDGRIGDVLQSHHVRSGEDLETTLHRCFRLCNRQLTQSALGSKSPLQAMKDRHELKPQLFREQPYDLPGCDSSAELPNGSLPRARGGQTHARPRKAPVARLSRARGSACATWRTFGRDTPSRFAAHATGS
jgi:hypothetical protein